MSVRNIAKTGSLFRCFVYKVPLPSGRRPVGNCLNSIKEKCKFQHFVGVFLFLFLTGVDGVVVVDKMFKILWLLLTN